MAESLLKTEYPSITTSEMNKIIKNIHGKCSEYYFLDFLRCADGNVKDAIKFFYLDEKLRSLLIKYLVRFEIQLKNDFAETVQNATGSKKFWAIKRYYLPEARAKRRGKKSKFERTKKNINSCINRLKFKTMGPSNYVAMYSISFGAFKTLFRYIDLQYKTDFINKYTTHLSRHDFNILYAYFDCIRIIRNRCAHGNHIITAKLRRDLNTHINLVNNERNSPKPGSYITVFETSLLFMIKQLNCGNELRRELLSLFNKNLTLLKTYSGKHSLSSNVDLNL